MQSVTFAGRSILVSAVMLCLVLAAHRTAAFAGSGAGPVTDDASCKGAPAATLGATLRVGYPLAVLETKNGTCVALPGTTLAAGSPFAQVAAQADISILLDDTGLTLQFFLPQDSVTARAEIQGADLRTDDTIGFSILRPDLPLSKGGIRANARMNARGICETRSTVVRLRREFQRCSGSARYDGKAWGGTLTVTYDDLLEYAGSNTFAVAVERRIWSFDATKKRKYHSTSYFATVASGALSTPVTLGDENAFGDQQYAAVSGMFGDHSAATGVSGRVEFDAHLTVSRNTLLAATVADDAGGFLAQRNNILSGLVPDDALVKSYACSACQNFQTTDTEPFQAVFTFTDRAKLNLDSLGLDAVPIDFTTLTSPIDFGSKVITRDRRRVLAIAQFNGSTAATGDTFRDIAYRFADAGPSDHGFAYGIFHVVANHDLPSLPFTPAQRSANTLASLAYSFLPHEPKSDKPATDTLTTLVRAGTQYQPDSGNLEFLQSYLRSPGLKQANAAGERSTFALAAGYRDVGARYAPLDATIDPTGGTRGLFGGASLSRELVVSEDAPVFDNRLKFSKASVVLHRFFDAVRARDVAIDTQFAVLLRPTLSLSAERSNGSVAASVAGRSAGLAIDPFGTTMFRSSTSSLSLASSRSVFPWKIGYQIVESPNCSDKVTVTVTHPLPCDPLRSAGLTASAFTNFGPGGNGFMAFDIGNSLSNAIGSVTPSNQTTVARQTRSYALGYPLGTCSRLVGVLTNREGDVDQLTAARDRPGLFLGGFLEINLKNFFPQSLLAGYIRNTDFNPAPDAAPTHKFFIRLVAGAPIPAYARALTCS